MLSAVVHGGDGGGVGQAGRMRHVRRIGGMEHTLMHNVHPSLKERQFKSELVNPSIDLYEEKEFRNGLWKMKSP